MRVPCLLSPMISLSWYAVIALLAHRKAPRGGAETGTAALPGMAAAWDAYD